MASWKKWQCRGCGIIISNPKERRTLDPDKNPKVYQLVVEYLRNYCQIQEPDAMALLELVDVAVKGLDRSYICKKTCFTSLNKVVNYEQKIAELNAELKQIKQAFLSKIEVEKLYTRGHTPLLDPPSSKRRCTSAGHSAARELFADRSGSGKSPAVTVRRVFYTVPVRYCMQLY